MNKDGLTHAVEILNAGGVVGIPTETVYGLAARVDNPSAVNQVFALKNRPKNHPLIVHIGRPEDLYQYAQAIPAYVSGLIENFWPGPLTFLLKKTDAVSELITGGQDTVGIRMPNHPLTLQLLNELGSAVVAPSANPFMQVSPTTPEHVQAGLGNELFVLDGGPCEVGIESTIIDVTSPQEIVVLRPGMISRERLEKAVESQGISVRYREAQEKTPKVSGDCPKHYSPRKTIKMLSNQEAFAELLISLAREYGENVGIYFLSFGFSPELSELYQRLPGYFILHDMPTNPEAYARVLYEALHEADDSRADVIVLEAPPRTSEWVAIWDRLSRAAASMNQGTSL